jgi:tripartite-type tricarboxylate transporter receptor subunit TctC
MKRSSRVGMSLAMLCVPALAGAADAQPFPAKPLRILVGFPAGSTPDVVTRTVSEKMTQDLGRQIVIENRPGAGGTIATEADVRRRMATRCS